MTEEEKTEEVSGYTNSLKEAIVVLVLSTVVGIVADIGVQKGYVALKTRRARKAEVAATQQ